MNLIGTLEIGEEYGVFFVLCCLGGSFIVLGAELQLAK
jgi:hypothetical protein